MCGILGIINLDRDGKHQTLHIHKMANKIRHRGPDDEGYLLYTRGEHKLLFGDDTPVDKDYGDLLDPDNHIINNYDFRSNIAFGHRRLSIIDLSLAGHQPMSYMDRYWIVYNGEVYNYIEIRKELEESGYKFISKSDTEMILAAYDLWGCECLKKFNGMWAFAIYDEKENKLFMSRDRFGKKPLYYYKDDKIFIFASEIKAILEHPDVQTEPNLAYCLEYLKEGPKEYIKETAFKNIFRLMHACYFEISIEDILEGEISEKYYWTCETNIKNEKFEKYKAKEYAKRYYELLSDSVRIRLRADVNVGGALSGGLDSSTIVYMINQHLKREGQEEKLETFSSVYKSSPDVKDCDESSYIDELSVYLNVHSNQIEPRTSEIIGEHRKMIYAMENPAVGPNMGGWYTFKLVGASDVTINLDGQGADEQLGGYYSYLWRHFANLPIKEVAKEYRAFSILPNVSRLKLFGSIVFNVLKRVFPKQLIDKVIGEIGAKYGLSIIEPVNKILNKSVNTGLINLIHFGDSQSMAHSIESRLPFMDYRLVEYLASVPAVYKIHNGWTKYLARLAMDKKLPDNITWRRDKMGWPDPAEYWFRGELKEWLCGEIENSTFLKSLGVGRNIRERIESKEPIDGLIRMLNLAVWHKTFYEERKDNEMSCL
jgi:asparagine synthase (glutamine-hydrolysing)